MVQRARLIFALALSVAMAAAAGCARRHFGPNDPYRDPRITAADWNQLFEGENREVYRRRADIIRLLGVRPGMDVVDVGAGTGVFTFLLSDAVGHNGRVYAEEIVDKFTRFIAEKAARERRTNVVSVAGTETGVGLPPGSVDLAFLCDVYHHFDQPAQMLASIRQALRPGGQLVLVEFRREPGQSPAWILEHVRAGEDQVTQEIQQAGFVSTTRDDLLRDNYVRRFRR